MDEERLRVWIAEGHRLLREAKAEQDELALRRMLRAIEQMIERARDGDT